MSAHTFCYLHTAEEALDTLNENPDASDSEREMHDQDIDASRNSDPIPVQPFPDGDSCLLMKKHWHRISLSRPTKQQRGDLDSPFSCKSTSS